VDKFRQRLRRDASVGHGLAKSLMKRAGKGFGSGDFTSVVSRGLSYDFDGTLPRAKVAAAVAFRARGNAQRAKVRHEFLVEAVKHFASDRRFVGLADERKEGMQARQVIPENLRFSGAASRLCREVLPSDGR
jgi:hypothetical protein